MYLFFDTSAIGQPKNWRAAVNDPFNWPRMFHLAWLHYNEDRELIAQANDIIKPEGFEIPIEAEQKHKVTWEEATEKGVPLKDSLEGFKAAINEAKYVIAHNMKFNEGVVGSEFVRKSITHRLHESDKYCLMQEATWYTKVKGTGGRFKWPTLQQIHQKIYGNMYAEAGNAQADVAACTVCFFSLLDLEAIDVF